MAKVKNTYKIPASLDSSYLDMEIAVQNKNGVGLRPLPVRVLLVWLIGIIAGFWFVFSGGSPLGKSGIGLKILFAIVWILFLFVMARRDATGSMQLQWIPAVLNYLSGRNRRVLTRRINNAGPFYGIVGIESIDPESGLVKYTDGSFAYWYMVVGTASVLLFPEDRDAILDRVRSFYDKIGTDCEIIFMTAKEPQRVHHQKAHLIAQYDAMEFKDSDIDMLVREQYNVLDNVVGKEFKSIHQYMILKGDSKEALSMLNDIVKGEYQTSSMVFKQVTALYRQEIEEALASIYRE